MAFGINIKLPTLTRGTGLPATATASTSAGRFAPSRGGQSLGGLFKQARRMAPMLSLMSTVFFLSLMFALPTRAIAWRISQAAKAKGYLIDVRDVSISPLGAVTLHEVTWHFKPSRPGEPPVPFVAERVDVRLGLLRYLVFGSVYVSMHGQLEEGTFDATMLRTKTDSTIHLELTDVPLYGMPKAQQTIGAPLDGQFSMLVDLTVPENSFALATGEIHVMCSACAVGDGDSKLHVPGARGMMENGLTIPRIELGSLDGTFTVADGQAVAEEFEASSDDVVVRLSGKLALADPVTRSILDLRLKVKVADTLLAKHEEIRLVVASATKARMDPPEQDWLAFLIEGSVGSPRFRGIKVKTREEKLQEIRDKRERDAKAREKAKLEREAAKKEREAAKKAAGATKPNGAEGVTFPETPPSADAGPARVIDPAPSRGTEEREVIIEEEPVAEPEPEVPTPEPEPEPEVPTPDPTAGEDAGEGGGNNDGGGEVPQ